MKEYSLFSDGSIYPNPNGIGTWCYVLIDEDGKEVMKSGWESPSTNNRMEMKGVIEGLRSLPRGSKVTVYTDSQYVCNPFLLGWIKKWRKDDWTGKKDLKNKDMWKIMWQYVQWHDVSWEWVKGHADNKYNNLCDEVAGELRKELSS